MESPDISSLKAGIINAKEPAATGPAALNSLPSAD
jgi:hypothetical protein